MRIFFFLYVSYSQNMSLFILLLIFSSCSSEKMIQIPESDANPLIILKIPNNQTHLIDQINDLLRQFHYQPYIELQKQECHSNQCKSIALFNSQGTQLQEIKLPSSMIRIKQLLKKHIEEEKVTIRTQFKDTNKIESLQNRNRIVQIHQKIEIVKKEGKRDYQEEWQRAQFPNRSNSIKKKKQHNNIASIETKLNKTQILNNLPTKKSNQGIKLEKTQNIYLWYLFYLAMMAGVILGMRYMKSQQQRFDKMNLDLNEGWGK